MFLNKSKRDIIYKKSRDEYDKWYKGGRKDGLQRIFYEHEQEMVKKGMKPRTLSWKIENIRFLVKNFPSAKIVEKSFFGQLETDIIKYYFIVYYKLLCLKK